MRLVTDMPNLLLERLKDDHKRFECLFAELERQCAVKETGSTVDERVVQAITNYLAGGVFLFHHALEDIIYARLLQRQLRFGEIYDVAEDHKQSWREFERLASAVSYSEDRLIEAARSFIGNERGHFILEEEIFLPYAARLLGKDDWWSVERSVAALEPLATDYGEPIIAALFHQEAQLREPPEYS